ncbi:MAG: hypothetical protein A2086_09010 [Spirochaetes bacterium GWD1_27_9]|nr:MAG: hypothetical protein A2Z98_05625 [Spirochaetes bacterium GWB1_27_13]OHD26724.1 MAG: hypothetical protein A2Y34_10110 [Spirochaetes bacterium GWC1_27_15]OHD44678.1 MAG: hypothetical protein A2086_09010 [Spirochaetes bacterium GWD1_27_9]
MKKFIIILPLLLTFNCLFNEAVKQENKTLTIKKIETIIENIDYSYWNTSNSNNSLYYNFYIYYNENDIEINDIEYCKLKDMNDRNWTINLNEYFDSEDKYIGGYFRFYDNDISNNGSVLMLKDLRIIIKLKNNIVNYDLNIDSPTNPNNENSNSEYLFVYNEDYKGRINKNYIYAIKRSEILNKEKKENNIKIEFIIDDKRVKTGKIWFYNKENKYSAYSKTMFVNEYSGEIANFINNGKIFNTDGNINILNIKNEEIQYKNNSKFEDITYCHIMLSDDIYDNKKHSKKDPLYRSISEKIVF